MSVLDAIDFVLDQLTELLSELLDAASEWPRRAVASFHDWLDRIDPQASSGNGLYEVA